MVHSSKVIKMKEYLEIPMSDLKAITYTNSNRIPNDLEINFINEIAKQKGFFIARIKLYKVEKLNIVDISINLYSIMMV